MGKQILESKRASNVPGDDLRVLTHSARSSDGDVYPTGTEFRPLAHGVDGGHEYQLVTIAGRKVEFCR